MAKKKTVTFRKLREIDVIIGNLFKTDPSAKGSRFGLVYQKFFAKYFRIPYSDFSEALDLARLKHALEDKNTGEVLFDRIPGSVRPFKYDKKGLEETIKLENAIEKKWDEKEIDIEAMISPFVPRGLSAAQVEDLVGIFFESNQVPKEKEIPEEK